MGLGGDSDAKTKSLRSYTLDEVSKHNKPGDAWIVIQNKVYDVSHWEDHPGGSVMFTQAGYDATDSFSAFHPASASTILDQFLVGAVDRSGSSEHELLTPFEKEYRALKATVRTTGLTRPSAIYYVWKVFSTFAIVATAAFIVVNTTSWSAHMFAALLVALFWQQCGWLSHDFLHHQVFRNRHLNNLMGFLVGGISQGFSVAWWKNKHNTHHAVPNMHGADSGIHAGDPDIDTVPILAWSRKMGRKMMQSPVGAFILKRQAFLYFPILFFARLSWLQQSAAYVFGSRTSGWGVNENTALAATKAKPVPLAYPVLERVTLILYYVWNIALLSCMPLSHALAFFFVAQTFCGLFLAIAFGVGHNGMAVYDYEHRPGFAELQVTTTRNVHPGFLGLVGWFMGGLHYQVEHHLFPNVPRHNLHIVKDMMVPLCKKHNVPYHCTGLWDGTLEVLYSLDTVTKDVMRDFPAM